MIDGLKQSTTLRDFALLPDTVHALSCSNNAFASLRSGVSKPSVNLVEEMRWKGDAWLRAIP
jgi:hypothetical protein